jgi:iron complex outermembrane recepter protein
MWMISAVLTGPMSSSLAFASVDRLDVNLRPGPLAQALDDLARSAQLQVLYDPDLVRGRSTEGLTGLMTPAEAIARLLATTDVGFTFTAGDAVALYKKAQPASMSRTPPVVMDQIVERAPPTVTVTGRHNPDSEYGLDTAGTAMKIDGPALLAPVASQSLTQSVLRDQQVARLEDILENVSAIELVPSGWSAPGFAVRGFPTYQYYVDGVRASPDLHHDGFRDLANVERIDVIKGPASTLYGRTEPGGLINLITKQPLSESFLSLEQQTSSFGRQRTQVDAGGPLLSDRTLLYRFNAAGEMGHSFRQFLQNRRIFLTPVVTWKASPRTETTAYVEYLNSVDFNDSGLPVIGDQLPPVSVERNLAAPAEGRTSDLRAGIRGSHALNDRWTVRHHFEARWLSTPQSAQFEFATDGLDPVTCDPSQCPVDRLVFAAPVSNGRTYYGSLELVGVADLWGTRHSILLGAEQFDVRGHNELLWKSDPSLSIDLFNPSYGPLPAGLLQNPDSVFASTTGEQWTGVYLQDQVALSQQLYLVVGARYDHVRESLSAASGSPTLGEFQRDTRWDNAFKRRAGLVWRLAQPLSVYASYLENFGTATGLSSGAGGGGSLLPPESAHEWEVGVKAELLEGRGAGSLTWFDLTKLNVALPDPNSVFAAQGFRVVTGATRNRGLEFDLHGEILPNLQLLASYAYIESRILDRGYNSALMVDNTGHRLFGVPHHGGSVWLTYETPQGPFRGLKLGAGAVVRGMREGDNANDYQLPAFMRWSALAAYSWHVGNARLRLQMNVDNVFDARYFESLSGSHTVVPGAPRMWRASIHMEL